MFPFIYDPEKSYKVHEKTLEYLDTNPGVKNKIQELSWGYHSLHDLIPETYENLWSGHRFPYTESWDEIQISYTLASFGLYKQAMVSLRSALELGLLSVYYNINDEGHKTVKKWLMSDDSKEADTPRIQDVWKILIANESIKSFQAQINIKERILKLGYLHNFVHTKGHKYSNQLGVFKSNFQTFESKGFTGWLDTLEEIIVIVTTLHLLKYPAGLVQYDFSKKFGIEAPLFSHLQWHQIERIKRLLPIEYMETLIEISSKDPKTQSFIDWLESQPDISEEEVEDQIIEHDKMLIQGMGINKYIERQLDFYQVPLVEELPEKVQRRLHIIKSWADENGFTQPKFKNDNEAEG